MARNSDRLVALIGVFKLIKAGLLIAFGVAGLISAPSELAHQIRHALAWMGLSPGHHTLARMLGKLGSFDDGVARELAVASLCYAAVFLVEGIGLLKKRRWAEWLTVGVTASFIPIEIYEAVQRFSLGKIAALILNLAIVIYLVWVRVGAGRTVSHRLGRMLGYRGVVP
jgi:uncharacterized membrane protein (DUF2068 family)